MSVNFFYYRLPGCDNVRGYKSKECGRGFSSDAFVIVPFDYQIHPIIHIPAEEIIDIGSLGDLADKAFGEEKESPCTDYSGISTRRKEHAAMIESVIGDIKQGKLNKCVISRVIGKEGSIDVRATFENLCRRLPDAYVFCYYSPLTGLWMGASPELLLECDKETYRTVALAGTKKTGDKEDWDDKNREEQCVVKDFITAIFRNFGLSVKESQTTTLAAGPVSHLITRISGQPVSSTNEGFRLALSLSPTPALSGYPQQTALMKIAATERHDRECYGGFIGMVKDEGDFAFYVNLRSMNIQETGYVIYCGGGIMKESETDREWEETENKSRTLLQHIKLKNAY